MKKKIIFSALALAGMFSLTGCSDFLDPANKSDLDSDTYFSEEKSFEELSTYPYYKLRSIYGDSPNLFCSGTDLYEKGRSNYASTQLSLYKDLNADNTDVMSFYKNCFDGIQQCNTVLYYGEGKEDGIYPKRCDEAKALRAFYYYLLSQQIGGVPVIDKYIANTETAYPRQSQDSVYKFVIKTLQEVETHNVLPMDDHTGRVSMRTVYNFLAKACLAYAWDFGTTSNEDGSNVQVTDKTYFNLAAQYADKAINGQTPTMTFSGMWDVANDNNNDVIFAIQYTKGLAGQDETIDGNHQQAQFGNYYNDADVTGSDAQTKYTTSQFPPSEKLIYLFEPGDDRFQGTFMVEQYSAYKVYYGEQAAKDTSTVAFYFPAWYEDLSNLSAYNKSSEKHKTTKVFSTSNPCVYVNATVNKRTGKITYKTGTQSYETSRTSTSQTLCVRKFDDYTTKRNLTKAVSFHDIVLAHLTETYLLGAEAYYMAGNEAKALQYVNVVRNRSHAESLTSFAAYKRHYSDGTANSYNNGAGIANVPFETGLNPLEVILDERARELCGEYYRWMDLRRTKKLIEYNVKYNSGVTSKDFFIGPDGKYRWFRPFPQGEINLNSALTNADQNPGYVTSETEEE